MDEVGGERSWGNKRKDRKKGRERKRWSRDWIRSSGVFRRYLGHEHRLCLWRNISAFSQAFVAFVQCLLIMDSLLGFFSSHERRADDGLCLGGSLSGGIEIYLFFLSFSSLISLS